MGKSSKKTVKAQAVVDDENATPTEPTEPAESVENIGAALSEQAPEAQEGYMEARAADAARAAAQDFTPPQPATPGDAPKRGRPRKADADLKQPRRKVKTQAEPPIPPPTPGPVTNAATAAVFTGLKEGVLVGVIGDEWKMTDAEKSTETALLTEALNKYAPDGMEVNPLILYGVVSFNHAMARFNKPKTHDWWVNFKAKMAAKYVRLRYGRNAYASQSDNRANHERQNNAGNSTGENSTQQPPTYNS